MKTSEEMRDAGGEMPERNGWVNGTWRIIELLYRDAFGVRWAERQTLRVRGGDWVPERRARRVLLQDGSVATPWPQRFTTDGPGRLVRYDFLTDEEQPSGAVKRSEYPYSKPYDHDLHCGAR